MKLVIVGEAPSRHSDPRRPFEGASGRTLAKLAGLSCFEELASVAELRNVLNRWPGVGNAGEKGSRFPAAAGRAAARRMKFDRESLVLLCGKRVARAFEIEFVEYFDVAFREGSSFVLFPHPSGCNGWWNDLRNRLRGATYLRRVVLPTTTNATWLAASMRDPGPFGFLRRAS